MYQDLNDDSCCHIDVTKKAKFSGLEFGLTVARPEKAKRKICLSLLVHLSGFCLDVTVCANAPLAVPMGFKLRVSVTSAPTLSTFISDFRATINPILFC